LIPDNPTAQRAAEFVPAEQRASQARPLVGPVVCVQLVVTKELEYVAMESVGAALGADTDDAAHKVAELGRGILRDHVEFLNGINAWGIAHRILRDLIVIHAIEQEVIGLFTIAIDQRTAAREGRLRSGK